MQLSICNFTKVIIAYCNPYDKKAISMILLFCVNVLAKTYFDVNDSIAL